MQRSLFRLNATLERSHWWFVGRRRIIEGLIREIQPPGPGRRVIDVGCGTGANIASLAEDYEVVGFDLSEDAIAFARQRFPDVAFHLRDAVEYLGQIESPGRIESPEICILANDVIEHIEDDRGFLESVVNAAPSGSLFLLTAPADPRLWSPHDVSHGHFRRYTLDTFEQLWVDLPVSVLLHSYYNARLYWVVRVIRAVTSSANSSYGSSDSDLSLPPSWVNRWLTSLFSGELPHLRKAMGSGKPAYRHGVSVISVLKKDE